MKAVIRDVDAVMAVRPVDAALYLRAMGWSKCDESSGRASLWTCIIEGEEFEALLPMDTELRDYALRIGDLITVLSVVENRSQWLIYSDLLTITSDVMRIRINGPELVDGSLPIEEHAQIAQKARDLVLAAACAATDLRPVWHKRKPAQAMDYVRGVRIGQSERGSYVVKVISKITPLLHTHNDQSLETKDPYERQVTRILAQSLHALTHAAEQAALTQEMAAFDQAIPYGVNANLCDAVAGLKGGEDIQWNLEFVFSWSPGRPISDDVARRVVFSSDRIPVIREAGRQMREREPLPDYELRGPVIKLERTEGAPTGRATIIGLVEDRQARIVLDLDETQYHTAVLAHDQGRTVQTNGILMKSGYGYVLKNACDLMIEPE